MVLETCGKIDSQTSSSDTSVLMSSSKAGLCDPQLEREAGCIRSSKTGLLGVKLGVPLGYEERTELDILLRIVGMGDCGSSDRIGESGWV